MNLLVRLPNWLGDTVMAVPTLESLRAGLGPGDRIAVAGPWAKLLAGQGLAEPCVTYPRSWTGRLRAADSVALLGADTALVLPNSTEAALAAWYWGARRRIGYDAAGRGWLLTDRVPLPAPRRHQVDEYLALLAPLGISPVTSEPRLRAPDDETSVTRLNELLAGCGAAGGEPLVGIHLGAAFGPSKVWPVDRVAQLCTALHGRGVTPLLLGTAEDSELERGVRERAALFVPSLVGRDRPDLLPALLARLDALVSGDTGTAHLAAAVGTNVITLFGPTDPELSAPRGPVTAIAKGAPCAPCFYARCPIDHVCMRAIGAEEVAEAVLDRLGRADGRRGDALARSGGVASGGAPALSVLHTEASPGWGGQEVRTVTEAAWLDERGVRVLIAAQPDSPILHEARRAAVEAVGVRMRGPWDVPAMVRLARLIHREKIDLVHTHSSIDAWVGGCAARIARVPVVRSRHVSIPIRRGLNPVYTWLADRIITSGDEIRRLVLAGGVRPQAVVALPAGVDLSAFAPGAPSEALRAELGGARPVIGSIAMFRGSKGHLHLLDAFQALRRDFPDARLLLVGDGVRRRWVEDLARERGLADAVRFTGFRRNVADLLRLMDCFVLASTRTEGVPQSLLQAMAVGVPVVASAIGGIPEVITDAQTGLLVEPGDPAALAAAIREVLGDRASARQRAAAARRVVQARHSRDLCVDRLLALYGDLV